MSRYKPIGVSFLPERIERIDARAKELGLSRSRYLQALVDADIDGGLLDCTKDAETGEPVVKVKDGVSVVVLDKKVVKALSVEIAVKTIQTLSILVPELQMKALSTNVRKIAERVVTKIQEP